MNEPLRVLIGLAVVTGVVLLQIFLSKREAKFPGLILPIVSVCFSVLFVLNMAVMPGQSAGSMALETIAAFLLENIPTAVLLAIYFACRKHDDRKKQLNKMSIQDLN